MCNQFGERKKGVQNHSRVAHVSGAEPQGEQKAFIIVIITIIDKNYKIKYIHPLKNNKSNIFKLHFDITLCMTVHPVQNPQCLCFGKLFLCMFQEL